MCSAGGNPLAFWFRFPQLADFLRSLVAGSPSAWLLLCLLFVLLMGWPGRAQRPKTTVEQDGEASKLKELTMHTGQQSSDPVATIGLDIGKNTFHLVGLDKRGAIALRIKVSRSQLVRRLVNLPPCLVGLEAGSGSHHIARQIQLLGHEVRLIPAQYVKPFLNETTTYCSPTRDRGSDHLSVSSAVRGDRSHLKAIRVSRHRGSRCSAS